MNTMNKEKQMHLEDLRQKKNTWHKWYMASVCALGASFLIYFIAAIQDVHMTDNFLNLWFGVTILALMAFLVMFFKYRRAYDAVIFMKKELGMSVEEKERKSRFFSSPNPSWSERLFKYLGCLMCIIGPLIIIGSSSNWFALLQSYLPGLAESHSELFGVAMAMIGAACAKYHPELSLLARICLWTSQILIVVGIPLFLMGCEVGSWLISASIALSLFNLFRTEREIYFIDQEE